MSRASRYSRLCWLLGTVACNGIVGIEPLHDGPRPNSNLGGADSGGDSGVSGKSAGSLGGGLASGGEGVAGEGGAAQDGGAGEGGAARDGGAGEGAGPANGGAGGDGSVDPVESTVRGRVIDFWGNRLPNLPVKIGDQLTSTDEEGAFVLEGVSPTYDVSLVTSFTWNTVARTSAWVYQGLTRRDPTLQVVRGYAPRFAKVQITQQNAVVGANQSILVAIGGVDGNTDLSGLNGTVKSASVTWEGGSISAQTAHGLFLQTDPVSRLPTSYLAYDTTPVSLTEPETTKIVLDLANGVLDSGALQGTVTEATGIDRETRVALHFASGATMTLVDDYKAQDKFTYLVPSIPGSTLTVTAAEGDAYRGAFAVARKGGLTASSKPALKIPTPATQTSPAAGAENVDTATRFAFQAPAANPGPFLIQIENVDTGPGAPFETLYILTAAKQFTIPGDIAGEFALHRDNLFSWRVATHGPIESVDAMAGPTGFIQPFDVFYEKVPYGPRQEDGEYTMSDYRFFTSAK